MKVAREDNSALRMDDDEQTQPSQFVPARPGARRDRLGTSPGAYSQVDAARRVPRKGASEAPPAALQRAGFDDEATTERRSVAPLQAVTQPEVRAPSFIREAGQYASPRSAPAPGQRGALTDALPPSAPPHTFDRRPNVITEHPPTYVQRRDSSPTRLEIPDGPIGAPHRAFLPELVPSRQRAPGQQTDVEWPGLQPPVVLPDSLTPPQTATETDLPRYAAPRSSTLWLLSGVIAALVVLGIGVGLKHWRERSAAVSASPPGLRPAAVVSPQPEPPAPVEPPVEPVAKEAAAVPQAVPTARPEVPAPAAPKLVRPKLQPKPAAPVSAEPGPPELAPKRPAGRKVVGLPDNPY